MSHGDLYRAGPTGRRAAGDGRRGDPGCRLMPNMPETVIVMLAAASIGAIFRRRAPTSACRRSIVSARPISRCRSPATHTTTAARRQDVLDSSATSSATLGRAVVVPTHHDHDLSYAACAHVRRPIAPSTSSTSSSPSRLPTIRSTSCTPAPLVRPSIETDAGGGAAAALTEHKLHGDVKPGDRCSTSPPAAG